MFSGNVQPNFSYLMQPLNRWTFRAPKIRLWVEDHCRGSVLNLFAGKTVLNVDEFRVDASPEHDPDACMDGKL